MKNVFLLVALLAMGQTVLAQKSKSSKVPEAVKMAFSKAYPKISHVGWEIEKGNYEAEFEMAGDKEMSVVYDASGALLETEMEIPFTELPKAAQEALKGKKVKESSKITNAKGVVSYEAEVRHKDLMFDAQGKPMQ